MTPSLVADSETPVNWVRLTARGEDTRAFLQGQLSCDLDVSATSSSIPGLLLTPSGDVVTTVHCREHAEGVDIVVREELAATALTALRRFLLRTKCVIDEAGSVAGPYATLGDQVAAGEPGPLEFAHGLGPHSFGRGFVASHVSFSKGCYTGQELVGRLDARGGNVPFRLARVNGDDLTLMADVVSAGPSGERAVQGLTTVVDDGGLRALALVHRTLLAGRATAIIEGVAIELLHEAS